MASKKPSLGRNLNALLGGTTSAVLNKENATVKSSDLKTLPIEFLQRGEFQPRRRFCLPD